MNTSVVVARLAWAAEHGRVPILESAAAAQAGAPASLIDNLGSPEGIITLIGQSLRALHETAQPESVAGDVLFPDGWDGLYGTIAGRLERNEIQPESLPDPYRRYDAERLVEMWVESRPSLGDDAPVVCHGNVRLDQIIVDRTELVGFVGADAMCVGDRHLDLATVHQSLNETIGGEAAFLFYDAYGIDPNVVRLDHYLFANLLCQ